jgi:hypothetical protein
VADKIGLTLLQTELTYQGHFSNPSFRLLTVEGGLLDHLAANLGRFGARVADVRIETGLSLADAAVTCWLFGGGALIRVRPERLDGIFAKVPQAISIPEIVGQGFAAVQGCIPNVQLQSHTVILGTHAKLDGHVSADEFLKRYLGSPPADLGAASFRRLAYGFPGEDKRLSSSLEVEPSLLHPGALYARLTVAFVAREVSIEGAFSACGEPGLASA